MLRRFVQQKNNAVEQLGTEGADEPIRPILDAINSLKHYYTTSSCAGRIVVFEDLGLKPKNRFLGKWHGKVNVKEVKSALKSVDGIVWFRLEPAIFHIVGETIADAEKMLRIALASGFKRSGIQVMDNGRFLIEIVGTERIDAPITYCGKTLVSEEYIDFLVNLANKKYGRIVSQRERLLREIKKNFHKGV